MTWTWFLEQIETWDRGYMIQQIVMLVLWGFLLLTIGFEVGTFRAEEAGRNKKKRPLSGSRKNSLTSEIRYAFVRPRGHSRP
jgi:hypothetical protein